MSSLILFGDSFTSDIQVEYVKKYKKHEDYHWGEIVANTYNLNLVNLGVGSFSNDRILDKIIENFSIINTDDVVIIGKTFYSRFDIPSKRREIKDVSSKFTTITPRSQLLDFGFTLEEAEAIIVFSTIMDDKDFVDRTNLRYEFIKNFLDVKKVKNCIFWEVQDLWNNFENIKTATDGRIDDNHWSYKGHKDFANYILNKLNNE